MKNRTRSVSTEGRWWSYPILGQERNKIDDSKWQACCNINCIAAATFREIRLFTSTNQRWLGKLLRPGQTVQSSHYCIILFNKKKSETAFTCPGTRSPLCSFLPFTAQTEQLLLLAGLVLLKRALSVYSTTCFTDIQG